MRELLWELLAPMTVIIVSDIIFLQPFFWPELTRVGPKKCKRRTIRDRKTVIIVKQKKAVTVSSQLWVSSSWHFSSFPLSDILLICIESKVIAQIGQLLPCLWYFHMWLSLSITTWALSWESDHYNLVITIQGPVSNCRPCQEQISGVNN